MKKKLYIITSALPYVNNKLHLGHIYSTFLPADIKNRVLKMCSENTIFVSGSDVYGYRVYLDSFKKNIPINRIKNEFIREHKEALKYFNIDFDNFSSTDTLEHENNVNEVTKYLKEHKFIHVKEEEFNFCCKHSLYIIDDAKEDNNKCIFCKEETSHIRKKVLNSLNIKLSEQKFNNFLKKVVLNKTAKNEVKKIISDINNSPYKDKMISRPFDYGVTIKKEFNIQRVYHVWYEALISYITFTFKQWNKSYKIIQYMGKDNVFFHTILLSNIYIQYKLPDEIIAGCFLLDKNRKFSKSQNIGIFCKDIINKGIDSDCIRFALTYVKRENDINISVEEIINISNNIFLDKVLNCFQRFFGLIKKFGIVIKKKDIVTRKSYMYTEYISEFFLDPSLEKVVNMSERMNRFMNEKEIWKSLNQEHLTEICFALSCLSKILSIYCPNITKKLNKCFFFQDFLFDKINKKTIFYNIKNNMKDEIYFTKNISLIEKLNI